MLLKAPTSLLLVVHAQSRLAPAIHGGGRAIANIRRLMAAARRLDVPVLIAELNPEGLGATVPEVAAEAPAYAIVAEMHFSCAADDGFRARIEAHGRRQVALAGMEAHVCVLQTALDLRGRGYEVFVVADAASSRTTESAAFGLERARAAGAQIVTTEMVVFEWMERCDIPAFRDLLALIK